MDDEERCHQRAVAEHEQEHPGGAGQPQQHDERLVQPLLIGMREHRVAAPPVPQQAPCRRAQRTLVTLRHADAATP